MANTHVTEFLRSYLDALEAFAHGDELEAFFHPDAVQSELPHSFSPNGVTRDLRGILAVAEKARSVLERQRYVVTNVLVDGEQVVMEIEYTATLAAAARERARGASTLRGRLAVFFELRDGRIAAQRSYDCFFPLHETG